MRAGLQNLIKADNETAQLKHIHELYRRIHALTGNAGIAGFAHVSHMSAAVEALLKELYEKPKNINTSTLRTVAAAVDFLGFLFERGTQPDKPDIARRQHPGGGRRADFPARRDLCPGKSAVAFHQHRRSRTPP